MRSRITPGKYFEGAGAIYGTVYTVWRGTRAMKDRLATWFYRRSVLSCGRGTVFQSGVYLSFPKNIEIGSGCFVGSGLTMQSEVASAHLRIGDGVQLNVGVTIDFSGGVSIGSNSLISAEVAILTHDHGHDPHADPVPAELTIEDGVWVGRNALILPGVRSIGRGAVIGAGAVVTKAVEAETIVAGNPARVIGTRRSRE